MQYEQTEGVVGEVISDIDRLIRRGVLPGHVMSVADVRGRVEIPVLTQLGDRDHDHVVGRVDEILRLRAGGVD